jgi:hypothetical protein
MREVFTHPAKDVDPPAEDHGGVSYSRLGDVPLSLNHGVFPSSQVNHVQGVINRLPRLDLPSSGDQPTSSSASVTGQYGKSGNTYPPKI